MVTIVNMHDAKNSLIANHGKPIAMLTRIPNRGKKVPWDIFKGKIEMAAGFDDPLDEFKRYLRAKY
jgi:antitoxin (DNA-binding transcriptional repressor) of toxin-antitoxin stability system